MGRVALDTSAYAHLRRGHAGVLDVLSEAQVIIVPVTVLGELEAGFRLGSRYAANAALLADFLDEPFVVTHAITERVAARYGALFAALRTAGTPIPINDVWIAATALVADANLVTFDTDFERIGDLTLTRLS